MDITIHNKIGQLAIKHFKTLPKTGKPKSDEWTILSCIIKEHNSSFEVVALGTGTTCVGQNQMRSTGTILNDSHAEIICRRSFLRYLYGQMKVSDSIFNFNKGISKFCLKDGIRFHFFTTHVPCGDAAIFPKENIAAIFEDKDYGNVLNEENDGIPEKKRKVNETRGSKRDIFRTGAKCLKDDVAQDLKLGGSEYHVLGSVRTKPGRGDPTLSVSCSDKLARWSHLGIQGALLSILLEKPIYLFSFTISKTPFSEKAFERAVYERLRDCKLEGNYRQNKMEIGQTGQEFEYRKMEEKQPCPSSISWVKIVGNRSVEVAVEGRKQGIIKKHLNTEKESLKICKLELFKMFLEIVKDFKINLDCNKPFMYNDIKFRANDYQNNWKIILDIFKVWTKKDKSLLEFSAD